MRSVEDIIALLGGSEAAAERCGVGTEAIRKWRQSKAIPAKHWPAILTATGLTLAFAGCAVAILSRPASGEGSLVGEWRLNLELLSNLTLYGLHEFTPC